MPRRCESRQSSTERNGSKKREKDKARGDDAEKDAKGKRKEFSEFLVACEHFSFFFVSPPKQGKAPALDHGTPR
jgi:hypothetical protein